MSLWDVFVNANKNSRAGDDSENSEAKHIEKQFLDIWAESHSASTIDELNEYEARAWQMWERFTDHYDYRCTSNAQRGALEKDLLRSIDFKSTGHPVPKGYYSIHIWRSSIFQNQRDKIERRNESMERRNKSMERIKFGNRNLSGRS